MSCRRTHCCPPPIDENGAEQKTVAFVPSILHAFPSILVSLRFPVYSKPVGATPALLGPLLRRRWYTPWIVVAAACCCASAKVPEDATRAGFSVAVRSDTSTAEAVGGGAGVDAALEMGGMSVGSSSNEATQRSQPHAKRQSGGTPWKDAISDHSGLARCSCTLRQSVTVFVACSYVRHSSCCALYSREEELPCIFAFWKRTVPSMANPRPVLLRPRL